MSWCRWWNDLPWIILSIILQLGTFFVVSPRAVHLYIFLNVFLLIKERVFEFETSSNIKKNSTTELRTHRSLRSCNSTIKTTVAFLARILYYLGTYICAFWAFFYNVIEKSLKHGVFFFLSFTNKCISSALQSASIFAHFSKTVRTPLFIIVGT